MARLVDHCPSSDDELPDINTLIIKAGGSNRTKATHPTLKSPEKVLVPKGTSKSSTRKVRRLGGSSQRANTNPLFQRWNSETPDSLKSSITEPSKAPRVRMREVRNRTHKKAPTSQSQSEVDEGEEDGWPRLRVRGTQGRRPIVISNSEDDTDEMSGSDKESLQTRIQNLRIARMKTEPEPERDSSLSKDENAEEEHGHEECNDEDDEDAVQRQLREEAERVFISESESEDEERVDSEGDNENEASSYKTAGEESSDCIEDSGSEFELEDSPDQPRKKVPAKLLFGRPQKLTATNTLLPPTKNIPPLGPMHLNVKSKEPTISQKEATSQLATSVTKAASQSKGLAMDDDKKGTSQRTIQSKTTATDLADSLAKLRLELQDFSDDEKPSTVDRITTPPGTPPKANRSKSLISPSKHIFIPKTPHRPSMDAFWDQDTVNDWNDEHSPRKLILRPVTKSPAKASQKKEPKKEPKKAFAARKHSIAEGFLRELDTEITQGKIAELSASTGGVKLIWTKTLNTTAGRANWRRETIRAKADGTQVAVRYIHHASIELAEKVIDDEHRLLNVLAHEFCHLANFMVSGVTTNPHGREFKVWAAKCSTTFGHRGIEVTTKHTYEIDFKFVWECTTCGTEYKRHSRSIDPQRHRCGKCKDMLKQTKPVPRKTNGGTSTDAVKGADGTAARQPSRYQAFVKEQMRIVRGENPGSSQKELMRLIADKWAKEKAGSGKQEAVTNVASKLIDLTIKADT